MITPLISIAVTRSVPAPPLALSHESASERPLRYQTIVIANLLSSHISLVLPLFYLQ